MDDHQAIIQNPAWVAEYLGQRRSHQTDEEKMGLTIELSRRNVDEKTGEPFGAAIFRCDTEQASNRTRLLGQWPVHGFQ